jgi:predicted nuclease of restriction endonuclease-like (RecB) superfamily
MYRIERWSVRALRAKIDGLMFERTAIAKKPEEVVKREIDWLHQAIRLARERAAASAPQATAELARRARPRR